MFWVIWVCEEVSSYVSMFSFIYFEISASGSKQMYQLNCSQLCGMPEGKILYLDTKTNHLLCFNHLYPVIKRMWSLGLFSINVWKCHFKPIKLQNIKCWSLKEDLSLVHDYKLNMYGLQGPVRGILNVTVRKWNMTWTVDNLMRANEFAILWENKLKLMRHLSELTLFP